MDYPSEANCFLIDHACLLRNSYWHLLGKHLIPDVGADDEFARILFHAPFAVLSHDASADPLFNYANLTALSLFESTWTEITRLPSRMSAEPIAQDNRENFLMQVKDKGYIEHYQGVRVSQTGKRFYIKNAVVWNLLDCNGQYQGQAACLNEWIHLDS